ncbi:MAG: hypothetical protein ACRDN0_29925, partial [Trebonia sp.]
MVFTAVAAVLVLVAGIGDVVIAQPGGVSTNGFVPTAGSTSGDAEQMANAFLTAWGNDDLAQAAAYTNNPSAALPTLRNYWKNLHLRSLSSTVKTAVATTSKVAGVPAAAKPAPSASPASAAEPDTLEQVSVALDAKVAASSSPTALSGVWSYSTTLIAYQAAGSSGWYIKWSPDVVAPNITAAQHLAAITVAPQVIQVTDSAGTPLSTYNDPGLSTIAGLLEKHGAQAQGK